MQNIFHPNHWHAAKPDVVRATVRALGGDLTTMMELHAQAMSEHRNPAAPPRRNLRRRNATATPPSPAGRRTCQASPSGGSTCVITSEGNIALLTITRPWTGPGPDERRVGFTYRIWYASPS